MRTSYWGIVLQIVITGGIAWILKGISTINGSIKEIKTWQRGHEDLDELRWTESKDKFKTLFAEINKRIKGDI